jgi:hypothetical protein
VRLPFFAAILLGALALDACKREAPPPPPDTVPRDRPIEANAPLELSKPDEARVRTDLATARAAIREYQMLNSAKNPPDLSSLNLKLSYPKDLVYSADSGMVNSRTYPAF